MKKRSNPKEFFSFLAFVGLVFTVTSALAAPQEKDIDYRFPDGVTLRVHYNEDMMKEYNVSTDLASQVLDAAVMAYQTITQFQGFNSDGYSLTNPDKKYAYDPDSTVDIYLGSPAGDYAFEGLGSRNQMFKDAPCFDTIALGGTRYQAVILVPVNYKEFIKNWEKINPSPLGKRNLEVDLRGTLIHEMLHVVIFFYNKNLNKNESLEASSHELDWYVEGLARYFETFAGARHDFYSQGFKQRLPDKIRFSRGGSNYFMRYPDQAFIHLRYENALFWRYMDYRYGMQSIEALSRDFRTDTFDFRKGLEKVTGRPFEELLKDFAVAVLEKEFGLKGDAGYLNEIARTRILYRDGEWLLLDGDGGESQLGKVCATDWIGRWEDVQSGFESASVGGDSTDRADVSGWATDFIEITLDKDHPEAPIFSVRHEGDGKPLEVQVLCVSKGGIGIRKSLGAIAGHHTSRVDLRTLVSQNALEVSDIDHFELLITNTDPAMTAPYSLELSQ